jgi:hypothetical protein
MTMKSDDHMKRPALDRTRPNRSWKTVVGKDEAASGQGSNAGVRPGLETAISRSVELGYRVVDDYLQQGQRTAQRLSEGRLTGEAVVSEVQDVGARIARYASDFFGAWVELLDLAAAGSAARQQAAPPDDGPAAPDGEPPAAPRPAEAASAIRVEIAAARPTATQLDLRPERMTGPLRAHDLRSADARKPRLRAVCLRAEAANGIPVLRVEIPDHHPAGAYEGLIVDEASNRPVGSLRVVLQPVVGGRRRGSAKRRK